MTTMTPSNRIRAGLLEVHHGIADLRDDFERIERQQAARRADLVGAEEELRSLSLRSRRSRGPRHLLPRELAGTRRPVADSQPSHYYAEPDATTYVSSSEPTSSPAISVRAVADDAQLDELEDTLDGLAVDEVFDPEATLPSARRVQVGDQIVGTFDPRGAVVMESPIDEVTRRSLIRMGLTRDPEAVAVAPRNGGSWLTRLRRTLTK